MDHAALDPRSRNECIDAPWSTQSIEGLGDHMAVIRNFYARHDEDGGSEFFSLAREVITDELFVLHSRTTSQQGEFPHKEERIEIAEFLARAGPGRSDLLGLIGTLVVES